jgi:DNA recombination protein RmuC
MTALALGLIAALALAALLLAFFAQRGAASLAETLRLKLDQVLLGQQSGVDAVALRLRETERALTAPLGELRETLGRSIGDIRSALAEGQEKAWTLLSDRLDKMREGNEAKLGEIQKTVNEQLHAAVEAQMTASFARVAEQFAAVQKAIGDVQSVTAEISDLRRLFSNVKTRGGWGEAQLEALLDDILPAGGYEKNARLDEASGEAVEFAVIMPMRGAIRPLLAIDAKFPVEDYERMLDAAAAGDLDAERAARAGLAARIRKEAEKIRDKYIRPPRTVEFAVLYLPSDGLYVEVARIPGLVDEVGRLCRVLILGPSLFPALLRTIHLGHVTLALEEKADEVRGLLAATRSEMGKMDLVLAKLAKQAMTFGNTIDEARRRTRAVDRKLRSVETLDPEQAAELLGVGEEALDDEG